MGRIFVALVSGLALLLSGCALLAPLPEKTTLDDRLAMIPTQDLPLTGRTVIHWDQYQIPFIEAAHDEDAALALGVVHAHLRLGQMEILRRIAQGRLAEIAGPIAVDVDHGLRVLDFGRATAEIEASLPPSTRDWLESYVAGINHYQQQVAVLPVEFSVLGLEREPWRLSDVLTIGRLAGSDVNWLVWFNLLQLRSRDDWPQIWSRLVENGSDSVPSFYARAEGFSLERLLSEASRSGSNSLAVSGTRSRSGGAILANDPHLGIFLPNAWLIVGLKSPSYHAVGLMAPGLPIFAIGRNPSIAWGGTNMRAASSELYDLSGQNESELARRQETIRVRWWFDQSVTLRDSKWGPVVSDVPQLQGLDLPAFALRWTGHLPSDEITSLLALSRARSFEDFREAFRSFAVPGQNMLFADRDGNIGQVMAVRLPRRNGAPPKDIILEARDREAAWRDLQGADELPFVLNPSEGFLASANNRPVETETQVGYFFSPDDRVLRMRELLGGATQIDVDDIRSLQQDVYMASSMALRSVFLGKLDALGVTASATDEENAIIELMRGWDGRYAESSRGALAFELFRDGFTKAFYRIGFGEQDWAAFANVGRIKSILLEDVETADPSSLRQSLREALTAATGRIGDFTDWGDMHRLQLSHPLSNLPLVGGRYRFGDFPVAGSSDTLMKTAHATTSQRHATRYGANARHISDLSDPDLNFFALLGGQDGWLNSSTFMDQVTLWRSGDYIQLPLRLEKARARALRHTTLLPRKEQPGL